MNKLLTVLLIALCSVSIAQPNHGYHELIDQSEKYLSDKLASDHIVGLSAAIIIDGKVVWMNGFGLADREQKLLMTPKTVVNIGSVTKTFTSLAVMQLHEKGLLDIDKPLKNYLPGFNPMSRPEYRPDDISVKSLITHTSGIQSDVWNNSDLESGKYTDVPGFINSTYLLYPAGLVALYSNAGYNILGNLVKDISHHDYADYVHEHILAPLKMTSSGFAMDKLKNRTKIYAYGKEVKEYELRDIASGGVYANMEDFAKYAIGMLNAYTGKSSALINQGTARQMFSLSNAGVPIETNKKGLGWFMFKNDSTFAMYHAGSAGFAQAKMLLFPEKNAAVIVLTNTAEGGRAAEEFCFNMLPRFGLSIPDLFPKHITDPTPGSIITNFTPSILGMHAGSYGSSPYRTVSVDKGNLKMANGNNMIILKPVSKEEFVPYTIKGADTVVIDNNQRYFFKDIRNYHYLIQRNKNKENIMGYLLKPVDTEIWKKRTGIYEQFGYQLLIGDSKFKSVEIYITPDRVLMCRLKTMGSTNEIPLDVIDTEHAMSTSLNTGFGGFTVKFRQDGEYMIVDFGGITYRRRISG